MDLPRVLTSSAPSALGVVLSLLAPATAAGQEVGATIPAIGIHTIDGETGSLTATDGTLTLDVAGERLTPKAVLVHFFQVDCLQCEAEARALDVMHGDSGGTGAMILGLAHRGDAESVDAFRERLGLDYSVFVLDDDEHAKELAAGDATRIIDRAGVVRFAQAGFGEGDQKVWREAIQAIAEGRSVPTSTSDRTVLGVGDRLPVIDLPALRGDGRLSLRGSDGRLAFVDTQGRVTRPTAAVGFFSRY